MMKARGRCFDHDRDDADDVMWDEMRRVTYPASMDDFKCVCAQLL